MAISLRLAAPFLALLVFPWPSQAQFDNLSNSGGLSSDQLLRVEQAFRPQALRSDDTVEIVWAVEPAYYLYRKQFQVFVEGVEIPDVELPAGEISYDPFFDEELEIYRNEVSLRFPMDDNSEIRVRFQGCADAGYCYPPSWVAFQPNSNSDSVDYLGLAAGAGAPTEQSAITNTRPWVIVISSASVVLALTLLWIFARRFRASSN